MIIIRPIKIPEEMPAARRLIFEVAYFVFQDASSVEEAIALYEKEGWLTEMDDIQKNYIEKDGAFLVSMDGERLIGTGAIRFLQPGVCELKRLWLFPEYHGRKLGFRMLNKLMGLARDKGYKKMYLTTSPVYQKQALEFYHQIGFKECPIFDPDPDPDEVALTIDL